MHGATICGLRKVNISRWIGKLRVPLSWWRLVCCFSLRSLRPWLQKTVPNSKVHIPNPKGAESETSGEPLFWFWSAELETWPLPDWGMPPISFCIFHCLLSQHPTHSLQQRRLWAAPALWCLTLCTRTLGGILVIFLVCSLILQPVSCFPSLYLLCPSGRTYCGKCMVECGS